MPDFQAIQCCECKAFQVWAILSRTWKKILQGAELQLCLRTNCSYPKMEFSATDCIMLQALHTEDS